MVSVKILLRQHIETLDCFKPVWEPTNTEFDLYGEQEELTAVRIRESEKAVQSLHCRNKQIATCSYGNIPYIQVIILGLFFFFVFSPSLL